MKAAILTCLVLSVGHGWCQGRNHIGFEHKSPSAGVPFAWPSTWADVSSSNVTGADVLHFLADLHRDEVPPMLTAIQSFRFVPLGKDKFYLVADVDASGNGLFGDLQIVRCERAACVVGTLLTVAEDLNTDLVKVSGDGVFQVITKESPGLRTLSTWGSPPFVYSIWSVIGIEIVDVSSKYPEYFKKHILPRMEADRQVIETDFANNMFKLMRSVELLYVQDDYHRRILGEKTAGLDNALKWARSDDEGLREFGVKALEPIDSPIAAVELLHLATSGEPGGPGRASAADDARNALIRRAQAGLARPPAGRTAK